jgi:hypothetical protein
VRLSGGLPRRLLYAAAIGDGKALVEPRRWARSRAGAAALREQCAKLAVGWALRCGGAFEQAIFDADGGQVTRAPLWSPGVVARSDWRFSAAAPRLAVELFEQAAAGSAEPLSAPPVTVADMLLFAAVADAMSVAPEPAERNLGAAVAAANPLRDVLDIEVSGWRTPDWAALAPFIGARWLLPYLRDHLARRWLLIEERRGAVQRAFEQTLNGRLALVLEGLQTRWTAAEQYEALMALSSYLARVWRVAGGASGVLHTARLGVWTTWSTAQRETFEAGLGRLFALGGELASLAADLRGAGWERTAAAEAFLGAYARDLEPSGDGLARVRRELCRIV